MGGTSFSRDDYAARSATRSSTAKSLGIDPVAATFAYDHSIKSGAIKAGVHASLKPQGANREARDSAAHPVSVPIVVILDTTGSMAEVPKLIQSKLPKLMGSFLDDKASGKAYLGDGYPAILIGAVDDYDAMLHYADDAMLRAEGALQVGQFESGIEIDDNLTNIWLTEQGGGTYSESYELALYFAARHTAHDHFDKRGRRGYLFLIGDEHSYASVRPAQVKAVFGDSIQSEIPLADMIAEAQERYHVFFVIPKMTNHYGDPELERYWAKQLGQQNVIKLNNPDKICECIVGAVALCEEFVGVDDLGADLGMDASLKNALVPLSRAGSGLGKFSAAGLAPVVGSSAGSERL